MTFAQLQRRRKTLNVLLAGNTLEPSYLIGAGKSARGDGPCPRHERGRPLNNLRNLALWIVIALLLVFLFVFTLPVFLPSVALLGLSDVWLDFRHLESSPRGEA